MLSIKDDVQAADMIHSMITAPAAQYKRRLQLVVCPVRHCKLGYGAKPARRARWIAQVKLQASHQLPARCIYQHSASLL